MESGAPDAARPESPPAPQSPFRRLRARGLIFQALLGSSLFVVAAEIASGVSLRGRPQAATDPAIFGFFYTGLGIVLVLRLRAARVDVSRLFGPDPTSDTLSLTVVAIPLGVLSLAGFWVLFLPLSFAAPEFVRQHALDGAATMLPTGVAAWTAQLLVATIVAPVLEELFFRGLLFQRWAYKWDTLTAAIVSSALFAVCHVEIVGHFLFGMVMCALYLRTRSLWVPIAAHALNNFLASVFTLPDVISPDASDRTMTIEKLQSEWWIALLTLAVGLVLLEMYRRRFWPGIDVRQIFRAAAPYDAGRDRLTAGSARL